MKENLTKNLTSFKKNILTKNLIFFLFCLCIGTFTACGKGPEQPAKDEAGAEKKIEEDEASETDRKTETGRKLHGFHSAVRVMRWQVLITGWLGRRLIQRGF